VAAGIAERGETPFLHAASTNTPAIHLYTTMGFRLRREVVFVRLRAPGGVPSGHGRRAERHEREDHR
jgi:ribosomal protein S18 acetylase RimI-like enzyme